MMRWLCLFLLISSLAIGDNIVSVPEAGDGWILLFDGESLFGWSQQGGAHWSASGGTLTPVSDSGYLQSDSAFSDFFLKFDYRSAGADADCDVYLRAAASGDPKDTGYVLHIGDTKPDWPTGSVVGYFKADAFRPAPLQWHSIETTLSAEHIVVKLDGRQVAGGTNKRSRAGVIGLGCSKSGSVQFGNLKLKPLGMTALFNGSDLSGWKSVGPAPKKPGMIKKVIPIGGGKPKEANWSVAQGAIHGQGGEGQLESATMYDDFVVQLAIRVNSSKKGEHPRTGVFVRGDAGQLFSGYEITALNQFKNGDRKQALPESTGALKGLQPPRKVLGDDNQYLLETIDAHGRHLQVWIDGYPVTDFLDTRPEGTSAQKAARTAAGTISLESPDDRANLDFRTIQITQLPKALGKGPAEAIAIQPPPPAVPVPAAAPAVPAMPAPAAPNPNDARIKQLTAQSFTTTDPQQQKQIYEEILKLDPNNVMAANGYQQAQQKLDADNAARARQQVQEQQQSQAEEQNQAQAEAARQQAQDAFLAGDLGKAHTQIGIAEKSLSNQPPQLPLRLAVDELRDRIESAIRARTRFRMIWGGVGISALIGMIALLWTRSGKKDAYLEVISGLDKGRKFNLDQDVMHIGAIAEDGGNKNEIVIRDLERQISRFHCEIHKRAGKFFLIDCGSANGTRLDGRRLAPGKPVRVKSGARVELAGTSALRLGFGKKDAK